MDQVKVLQTNRRRDRQTDRKKDGQTDGWTDGTVTQTNDTKMEEMAFC